MLGIDSIADLTGASFPDSAAERLRVALLPSFHPDMLIDVELQPGGGCEVAVVSRNRSTGSTGKPWVELEECSREAGAALRQTIDVIVERGVFGEKKQVGLDGMTVIGELRTPGWSLRRFESWSPRPGSLGHAYAKAFYDFAAAHVAAERVQVGLEQIHVYLDLGLPLKKLAETPGRVRIFGSLSSQAEAELRSALRSIASHSPVIIDMSNFDNMGTILYPVFRDFLKRKGRTAWLASDRAASQLSEIGVPRGSIFADLASARRAVL
ncbi:MAG: hypothetical protein HY791_03450 [Deltaproteobacteria bacterium]|nr:hypothetical protein [Deltaproteobacteria bacterium]